METFVEFEGKQIHYRDQGKGLVLVLIHGFLENLNIWERTQNDLSEFYRVIAIDLPGHGQSSVYNQANKIEFYAQSIEKVLQELGIKNSVLIGHSMGGYVVQKFVELYPKKALGFGYFHSHAAADSQEAKINRDRTIKIVEDQHQNFIVNFIPDLFTPENQIKYNQQIQGLKNEAIQIKKEAIIGALEAMRDRNDAYNLLKTTQLPVAFIIGKQDIRAPMNELNQQVQMPKIAHVLYLEHVAHMGYIEDYRSCKMFIKGFVESCN